MAKRKSSGASKAARKTSKSVAKTKGKVKKKKTMARSASKVAKASSKKKTAKKKALKKKVATKKTAAKKKTAKKSTKKAATKKKSAPQKATKKKATKKKSSQKSSAKKISKKNTARGNKVNRKGAAKKKAATRADGLKKKGALASLTSFVKKLTGTNLEALEGRKAPGLTGSSLRNESLSLSHFAGKALVLYFYPKDNTSGCTRQGEDFRDSYKKFLKAGAEVVGVSRDSLSSHEKFAKKYKFPFDLLSDESETVCKAYGTLKMKSMYGRKYMGIERSTFVISAKGVVIKEWRKVKVPGHVEEVLEFVQSLK